VDGSAVDEVVRAGVERAVARIHDRVVDIPPRQQRPLELEAAAVVVALEQKQPLASAGEYDDAHAGRPYRLDAFRPSEKGVRWPS
jgi:hypothetical protein